MSAGTARRMTACSPKGSSAEPEGPGHQELLGRNGLAAGLQAVKVHPLVRGVFVDQNEAVALFHGDIGFEGLPQDLVVGDRRVINILNRIFDSPLFPALLSGL